MGKLQYRAKRSYCLAMLLCYFIFCWNWGNFVGADFCQATFQGPPAEMGIVSACQTIDEKQRLQVLGKILHYQQCLKFVRIQKLEKKYFSGKYGEKQLTGLCFTTWIRGQVELKIFHWQPFIFLIVGGGRANDKWNNWKSTVDVNV